MITQERFTALYNEASEIFDNKEYDQDQLIQ